MFLPEAGAGHARGGSGEARGWRDTGVGRPQVRPTCEGRPDLRRLSYLSSTEERSISPTLVVFTPVTRLETPDCWVTKNIGIAGTCWSMTLVASANLACAASTVGAAVPSL